MNQNSKNLNGETVFTWLMVKHDIELKIIRGEYVAGERIPSVRKIADIYNIGTSTATKTLSQLRQDGTIYKRRGVGYFVNPHVKDNLISEHKRNLEKIIVSVFEYAKMIGSDPMIIINRINYKGEKPKL